MVLLVRHVLQVIADGDQQRGTTVQEMIDQLDLASEGQRLLKDILARLEVQRAIELCTDSITHPAGNTGYAYRLTDGGQQMLRVQQRARGWARQITRLDNPHGL